MHMDSFYIFVGLGGGFALGFVLLFVAAFTRRPLTRYLCVVGWVAMILQAGAWLYLATLAGMCCGHGGGTNGSFVPWVIIAVFSFCAAFFWSRMFLRQR